MTDTLLSPRSLPLAGDTKKKRLPMLDQALAAQRSLTAVERFSQLHDEDAAPLQAKYYQRLLPGREPGPGEQYAFEVDLDACTGCKGCVTACHNANGLDEGEAWRSVGALHGGTEAAPVQATVTTACHHCVDPGCMKGCPVGAYEKDETTGIVRHLDDQCIGCQYCVFTCPYEVPKYNARLGIVRKCDMCTGRLEEGEAPACVQACPNEAIKISIVRTDDALDAAQAERFLPGAPSSAITAPTTRYATERALPTNTLPADYFSVRPAEQHAPLVGMLVVTQLSVGAFLAGIAAFDLLGANLSAHAQAVHAAFACVAGLLALGASTSHLGRPQYAFRAILGVRTSWLSREILAFGGFAGLALAYAAMCGLVAFPGALGTPASWSDAVAPFVEPAGYAVGAAGVLGVFASTMLYAVTGRRFWSFPRTAARFFGTTVVLGIAATMASLAATSGAENAALIQTLAVALSAAVSTKLIYELGLFLHLRKRAFDDLKRSALLSARDLRRLTTARFVLSLIGGIAIPAMVILPGASGSALSVAAHLSLILVFAGELAERANFFAAMAAPRMPGAFR